MKWWWKHLHKGWPTNSTVCTPAYNPALWMYTCDKCGERAQAASVKHSGGGVILTPPEGWRT